MVSFLLPLIKAKSVSTPHFSVTCQEKTQIYFASLTHLWVHLPSLPAVVFDSLLWLAPTIPDSDPLGCKLLTFLGLNHGCATRQQKPQPGQLFFQLLLPEKIWTINSSIINKDSKKYLTFIVTNKLNTIITFF